MTLSDVNNINAPLAVLFDWDGTLVDTLGGLKKAHDMVRESFGFPAWTEEQFTENAKSSSREIYPKIYGTDSDQAMERLFGFMEEIHLSHISILPGARDVLATLETYNLPFGVVSNKLDKYLVREVDHVGWRDLFFHAAGAGRAAKDKPAADPILLALEKLDIAYDNKDIWFVGDTVTDMGAARNAGCPAILITHGKDHTDLIKEYEPLFVVEDCLQLNQILNQLIGGQSKRKLAE